jgi:Putative collagen-binding domain of a collagenase
MNNGAGVEYYFGYSHANSDLTCQDFRSRENMWRLSYIAWNFFNNFSLSFWSMKHRATDLLATGSSNYCMSTSDLTTIIVYVVNGGTDTINLTSKSTSTLYSIRWYDPNNGGTLQVGTVSTITGGGIRSVGSAPINTSKDWTVLIRQQ